VRLELKHSTLSQLLRGKRRLTEKTIRALGARLGLTEDSIQTFVDHERRCPSNHTSREIQTQYAILELVPGEFKPDVGWIARVLGISSDEINVALAQLLGMGKLQMTSKDRWIITREKTNGKRGGSVADTRKRSG
jgi:hypothetical protein